MVTTRSPAAHHLDGLLPVLPTCALLDTSHVAQQPWLGDDHTDASPWLQVEVRCTAGHLDHLITTHLSVLLGRLGTAPDFWFQPQGSTDLLLRVKVGSGRHGDATDVVTAWASDLREANLIERFGVGAYPSDLPHYRDGFVMEAVAQVYATDSHLAHLWRSVPVAGTDSLAFAATSMFDIVESLLGGRAAALHWLAGRPTTGDPDRIQESIVEAVHWLVRGVWKAEAEQPWALALARSQRRTALTAYANLLPAALGPAALADAVLPILFNAHHARLGAPGTGDLETCLGLVRQMAVAHLTAQDREKA